MTCDAEHPTRPGVMCVLPEDQMHFGHLSDDGDSWPNTNVPKFVPGRQKLPTAQQTLRDIARAGKITPLMREELERQTVPEAVEDAPKLGQQLQAVYAVISDGQWHLIPELATRVGASQTSVSARIRDLRKEKFGAYTILRQKLSDGQYRYRMAGADEDDGGEWDSENA